MIIEEKLNVAVRHYGKGHLPEAKNIRPSPGIDARPICSFAPAGRSSVLSEGTTVLTTTTR